MTKQHGKNCSEIDQRDRTEPRRIGQPLRTDPASKRQNAVLTPAKLKATHWTMLAFRIGTLVALLVCLVCDTGSLCRADDHPIRETDMNKKRAALKRKLQRLAIASLAAAGVTLSAGYVDAQDAGKVITDAIADQISTGTTGAQGKAAGQAARPAAQGTQSATERGLNRALQGKLQGQSAEDAIRSGLGEAAQSSLESPQQTRQRDQATQLRNQQLQQGASGQTWYRDAQGRFYYQDSAGRNVYSNSAIRGDAGAQYRGPFGAQFNSRQQGQGVAINSVRANGFAANAGLRDGDVVMSVNGQPVQSAESFSQRVNQLQPNQQVQLAVMRDGRIQTVTTRTTDAFANDREVMAKPAIENSAMAREIERLNQELKTLRQEFDSLKQRVNEQATSNPVETAQTQLNDQ